jgi:septum formation protein
MQPRLILASTSRYRAQLLERFGIDFQALRPDVDETPLINESAQATAIRLAQAKCQVIAATHADAFVIGSDQVALRDGIALGKPHTRENAFLQLRAASASSVQFFTAVCVAHAGWQHQWVDITTCYFRQLDDQEIHRYIEREQPLDCAGSFKCEGLGISLFSRIESSDPTALIGLPLVELSAQMRERGFLVP